MAFSLGDIVAKATSSLPLPRLGRWDIQVKIDKNAPAPDLAWYKKPFAVYDGFKKWLSDGIAEIAGDSEASDYETIASFDSFIECSAVKDSQIVSQAIERGSFRSVNKIVKPMIVKVKLAKGGFYKGIETCLDALKEIQESTKLCRIVTPFGIAKNLNIGKLTYSYKRETGAHLLIAELDLFEIKEEQIEVKTKSPVDNLLKNTGVKALRERIGL